MDFSEYRKNDIKFIEKLKKITINSELIKEFKVNEIGINHFNSNYKLDVLNILKNRSEVENNDELIKYVQEVELINLLYREYYNSYVNKQIIKFIDNNSIFNFFCYISHFSYFRNKYDTIGEKDISQYRYNFLMMYEHFIFTISDIIKYYNKKNNRDFLIEYRYKVDYFNDKKFRLVEYATNCMVAFQYILNLWKNDCLEINNDKKNLVTKVTNVEEVNIIDVAEEVYNKKLLAIAYAADNYMNYIPNTKYKNFINREEFIGYVELVNIFYDTTLSEKMKNIEYATWLRAICLLIEKLKKECNKENCKCSVVVKKLDYWLDFFEQNGICRRDSTVIMSNLVFADKTNDYFDSPFIKTNKGFAIFPNAFVTVNPNRVIEEIMVRNKDANSKKGEYFENYIYNLLDENDIQYIKIKEHNNRDEYQCDLVIYYANEVYICELKNNVQSRSYKKYLQNKTKILKDIKQVTRLYNYYKQSESIKEEFSKKYKKKVRINNSVKYHKMIIYSNIIGKCVEINDTIICDIINFRDMLSLKKIYPKIYLRKLILMNNRYKNLLIDSKKKENYFFIKHGRKIKKLNYEYIDYSFAETYEKNQKLTENFLDNLDLWEKREYQIMYLSKNNNCLDFRDKYLNIRYK